MGEGESEGIVRGAGRVAGSVVAVTGPGSFLGRHLLGLCEEDPSIARLVTLDRDVPAEAGPKTRSYRVDLAEPDAPARVTEIFAAEGVDTVAHLGFLESPARNADWAHELESVGTLHLLHACRARGVRKIVLASTTTLYGPEADNPNFLRESHPLRGVRGLSFLSDKIDAEREVSAFAEGATDACVTVLRFAPVLGPTVTSYVTRWLSLPRVPTLLGFDPLFQCVHEVDALHALRLAVQRDVPGVFNITGQGVLPVSTVIKLAGRPTLPCPHFLLSRATSLLWLAGLSTVPGPMVRYLRYLCVADGERARRELGFAPAYTTREAILEFGATLRLREARLLTEAYG